MKKIFWPGILVGVVNLILGMLVSFIFMMFPAVVLDYKNTALIRPFADPLMTLFFLYPFVLGIILAWAWDKSKTLFHGTVIMRGVKFGLAISLISTIPGMFVSYTTFPISLVTIISWTVSGLICAIAAGIILAKINK